MKSKILCLSLMVFGIGLISCSKGKSDFVKVSGGKLDPKIIETIYQQDDLEIPGEDFSISVDDFYISKYEVTQKLYSEVMNGVEGVNPNPAYFSKDPVGEEVQELRPVERISWYDCLFFCNKLSEKEGLEPVYTLENIERYANDKAIKRATVYADLTKNGYRLPTNAEWHYAASGGKKFKGNILYSGGEELDEISWNIDNSDEKSHQVGLKAPNELGIYDMTGNVAEWCWDYIWDLDFENKGYVNYSGAKEGRYRFIKGGCFVDESAGAEFPLESQILFGGIQGLRYYNTGFRIVRNIE